MPQPPFAPGDRTAVTITSLAYGGQGVGRADGVTVFVPDVCPGETVEVEIVEVKARFVRARLLSVTTPSPQRVVPQCPLFGRCGGCHLQQLDYPAQVAAKTTFVRDAMSRVARMPEVEVRDCIPSPLPYGYRNKLELEATYDESFRLGLAYHGRDEVGLLPVVDCPIAQPEVNHLLSGVTHWLNQTGWPPYDEQTTKGLVREVGLRWSNQLREATMLLVSGRRELPDKKQWLDKLCAEFRSLVGIRHRARTRASQTPQGRSVSERVGRPMRIQVGELSLRVSPESFFQVNEWLLPAMIEQVRLAVDPRPDDHLADLYAGVGTFGLALAHQVDHVTLLEVDPDAANDAESNAKFNKLANVTVDHGQVEQRLSLLLRQKPMTKLLLDPPRQGCSDAVVRIAASVRARRIAYVSCDPSTLARDLARFATAGYRTEWVQPLDLFPQTYHVECIAALSRTAG